MPHHVPTSGACPLCHFGMDSTSHALFSCRAVKACWKETIFWRFLKQVRHMEVLDIAQWMKEKLTRMEFEFFAIRAYAIWSERLKKVHDSDSRNVVANVDWCEPLLRDFQEARKLLTYSRSLEPTNSPKTWIAPPLNHLRLDVDAAYNETSGSFAIGGVVRNDEGQPMLAFGKKITKPQSVLLAELTAIAEGLLLVQDHHLQLNQICSDSLLAVQAVTRPEEDFSYAGTFATDIRRLMCNHNSVTLSHVMRSANKVAHSLASFAISSSSSFVWMPGNFLLWVVNLVILDLDII
ncbi:uncharacterized protein [Primulina eburnea]|uniref:uncharacterized protein n=1 Tax=Primulina eburnea TaxID=1245227 RepID=UPI003C6C2CCC